MVVDLEVVLKVEEEVVGRHLATSEEIAGHPVVFVFGFVVVGVFAVGEDVDEEFSAGFEPGGDALQQELVVLHVLEHFDGDGTVEDVGALALVVDHVDGLDLDVGESALFGLGVDVFLLGAGV